MHCSQIARQLLISSIPLFFFTLPSHSLTHLNSECRSTLPSPIRQDCLNALGYMIADIEAHPREEGEITTVTRFGFEDDDYIVPKQYPNTGSVCAITVDVEPEDASLHVDLDDVWMEAKRVIGRCLPEQGPGRAGEGRIEGEGGNVVVRVGVGEGAMRGNDVGGKHVEFVRKRRELGRVYAS